MNVIIIPSWYPSRSCPNEGVYYRDQVKYIGSVFKDICFGISTWGQLESDYLIQWKEGFRNIYKLRNIFKTSFGERELAPNIYEFESLSFTWTRKFLRGNIARIIKANLNNIKHFEARFGKVDLIHAHSSHPAGYIAMEIAKTLDIPYIITEHMGPFPFKSYLKKNGQLTEYIYSPLKNACFNIAVSPALANKIEAFGLPQPTFIPNFVDEKIFNPKVRNDSKNRPFRFLTCANISYEKGIWHLLKTVQLISNNLSEVEFIMVGNGKDFIQYKELARELGISDLVIWKGEIPRDKISLHLDNCDAFILPSLHENFPIALLEAIACGKPVISTICGGPEFIVNETNGLLVKPGEIHELGVAILHLLDNYSKYNIDSIRKDFMERFSGLVVAKQIKAVYEKVINDYQS